MSNGTQGGRSLDSAKIEAAYAGFFTAFQNRLKQTTPMYTRLATVIDTDNVVDTQLWLSQVPKMRKWIGPKQLNKLRGESHPIRTEPYETSVEVPKHDILNDRLGLYRERIGQMGDSYGWALDDLVVQMLVAGVAGTSLGATYDGQNLIDTDHTALSVGGTAQSNHVAGALSSTTYNLAWRRFLEIKDENGNPVASPGRRMTLLVGPANRELARGILGPDFGAGGARNLDYQTADLMVHPRITGTQWFLVPEGSSAVLLHVKRGPEFLSVEEGEFVFRTAKFLYGIEAEFGAGYGLWQEIVGGPGV